ncbi:bifunctional acetate--CoA ligase family protein/GNAT family N-acetyltransferase [Parafrankia discariae]|uniref:bifunctional acetate--CoA ligase family protein/GNAT family N-acetyltransferase n=1 Tax=Parafrankia discariae TaxID=365528 RepID=UPI00038229EF|nr:bifunctional GNAT family N-acetyltransferase/acetate--CoA ligase family protein [Parafrankia discariae]
MNAGPDPGLPRDYPAHWEADVILSDGGTAHIRPIRPSDAALLRPFWSRLSQRTIYFRYFNVRRGLSDEDIARTTNVDQWVRGALVALIGGEIVALAHWEGRPAAAEAAVDTAEAVGGVGRPAPDAEVAFLVEDAQQGRGLGSVLLEHLAAAAAERGVRRFDADVLSENQQMIRVFLDAGYTVARTWESGGVRLSFGIAPTARSVDVMRAREHRAEAASMSRLLHPRAIAVVGAGRDRASLGNIVLRNLLAGGFDGPVYPVNPAAAAGEGAVASVRAYASVADTPRPVDLAVLCVPAEVVPAAVAACGRHGVRGLVVVTDQRDDAADARLASAARAHGMRVVGPASLGIQNPAVGLNASLVERMPPAGRIGCYSQSGPLGGALLEAAAGRRLGFSVFVSAGDRADVSGNDLLQYWEEDPSTGVALMHLETFGNPRKFARLARRLGRDTPVVVVLAERTPLDEALLRQAGVIGVDRVSQGLDVALLLANQPLPAGNRVAVVGDSRALVRFTARAADAAGLAVREVLLPVDSTAEAFRDALVSASTEVDALLVIAVRLPSSSPGHAAGGTGGAGAAGRAGGAGAAGGAGGIGVAAGVGAAAAAPLVRVPLLATVRGPQAPPELGAIPAYPSPEGAVAALRRAVGYAHWRALPSGAVPAIPVRAEDARRLVAGTTGHLTDGAAGELLACYGIEVVPRRVVGGADEAVAAADLLGWPVALKALSDGYRHRPDLGGQRLDLPDPAAVRAAWRALTERLGPDAPIVAQRMVPGGVAVVAGAEQHPRFGPLVSFGLAGPATELLGDRVHHILPLTDADAARLVRSVRAAPLLFGYRGAAPVDVAALEDLLLRLARLVDDIGGVKHLTLEPVIVSVDGVSVLSTDIVLAPPTPRADAGPRRFWRPVVDLPAGPEPRAGSAQRVPTVHNRLP